MRAYSDRINHALAFTAKHYGHSVPTGMAFGYMVHPASLALFLTRYGCDEATIVAGVVHHVLEEAEGARHAELAAKIGEKFGDTVLTIARAASEPRLDGQGRPRPWRECKQDYLLRLATAEQRTLDICIGDEVQCCGTTLTAIRRLGPEYLHTLADASAREMIWWYDSLLEILARRPEWRHRGMLDELRQMSEELLTRLRRSDSW